VARAPRTNDERGRTTVAVAGVSPVTPCCGGGNVRFWFFVHGLFVLLVIPHVVYLSQTLQLKKAPWSAKRGEWGGELCYGAGVNHTSRLPTSVPERFINQNLKTWRMLSVRFNFPRFPESLEEKLMGTGTTSGGKQYIMWKLSFKRIERWY